VGRNSGAYCCCIWYWDGPHGGNAINEGFLATAAPRYADVVVLLEIGMGVALLIGAVLARMDGFDFTPGVSP
jgi:hypothetical protein